MDLQTVLRKSLELNIEYRHAMVKNNFNLDIFKALMVSEYPNLHTAFPAIFNIAVGESYDFERLRKMLDLAEKVKTNEVSEHDASVEVGQILVDDIVKPQLNK
tara:strand:+ start:573 stop:881 length:309 start_codon:yes stop_codon:yes gene_type:complete